MIPPFFFQHLLNGLTLGSLYALLAVGLTITYGITRIINFSHNRFYMLAAYSLWILIDFVGLDYFVALPLTLLSSLLIGYIFDRFIIQTIRERDYIVTVVVTMCIGNIIGGLFRAFIGHYDTMLHTSLTKPVQIGPIVAYGQRFFSIPVTLITFYLLHWFLFNTKAGSAMRAYSQNIELCTAVGIDRNRISTLSILLSVTLAGLAAAIIAPLFRIYPDMGGLPINKAYIVICMGGFGNVKGALLSAYIIGIAEALLAGYYLASYRNVIGFFLGICVFLLRPEGIFGKKVGFEW